MEHSKKFTVYVIPTIMLIIALGCSFGLGVWRIREIAVDNGLSTAMKDIQNVFGFMAVFDASILLTYLAWVISIVRRQNIRNADVLKYKTYMYEVQKELFDFHRCTNSMTDALEKTGEMLTATGTFLCILEGDEVEETYLWGDRRLKEEVIHNILTVTGKHLAVGESILVDFRNRKKAIPEWDFSAMRRQHVVNAMLVPLRATSGRVMGVVGAVNMKQRWKDTVRLDEAAWNFRMALNNLEAHKIIRKMGTIDTMTGLKNRNSYEQGIMDYIARSDRSEENLCCIYGCKWFARVKQYFRS